MSYHCLSSLISFLLLSLCSFHNIIVFNFKFISFHISSFYIVFTWRLWAVDWVRKSLCSLRLFLSASILGKNILSPISLIIIHVFLKLRLRINMSTISNFLMVLGVILHNKNHIWGIIRLGARSFVSVLSLKRHRRIKGEKCI